MTAEGKEIEAKFLLPQLADIRRRVIAKGGRLVEPRVLERNLRFDTQDRRLTSNHEVLRLRQDIHTLLTYKYAHTIEERKEIEFEASDFDAAEAFLEALGFEVIFRYEKYRETFQLDPALIMLDELPFGCFIEVEAPSLEIVQQVASSLDLIWERRAKKDYLSLFESLRTHLRLPFRDATFSNFSDRPPVNPSELGLELAALAVPPDKDTV